MTKRSLILSLVTVGMLSSTALAQPSVGAKRESIIRFFQAVGMQTAMANFFKREVSSYQEHWPDAVITDFDSKGMFKRLSSEKASQMKNLIREFGGRPFRKRGA